MDARFLTVPRWAWRSPKANLLQELNASPAPPTGFTLKGRQDRNQVACCISKSSRLHLRRCSFVGAGGAGPRVGGFPDAAAPQWIKITLHYLRQELTNARVKLSPRLPRLHNQASEVQAWVKGLTSPPSDQVEV